MANSTGGGAAADAPIDAQATPVAVVIPTRDRSDVLGRAVHDALAQTYQAMEVIVVDAGSDPPVDLTNDLASDPRLRVVRLDTPHDPGAARNVGVASSSAPLIAFLDDDDEWHVNKLTMQVSALESSPTASAADCGYDVFENGRFRRRVARREDSDLRRTLLERPALLPSTLLVRRSAFDALGGFRTDLARTQDWEFALRLVDRYHVASVPDVLVTRHPSQQSPDVLLDAYRSMLEVLRPRIDALVASDRDRVLAWHGLVEGVHLADVGEVAAARAAFWRAWRLRPHSWRPAAQLVRTAVGDRMWRAVKNLQEARPPKR